MRVSILRQSGSISGLRRTLLGVVLLGLLASASYAEDHVWSSLGGGSFNFWLNWVPNFVPGEDDTAIFELGMDPAYLVTFYESVANERCIFRTDKVALDLGGCTYTLTYPGWGLNVAEDAGHVADVYFEHGTIQTDGARVGTWPGSDGTLELAGPLTMNVANHFFVGDQGSGWMIVNNNVALTADYATIAAHDPDSTGLLSLEGSDAEFNATASLRVGQQGYGILDLYGGAAATFPWSYVGDEASGYGEIYVTDGATFDGSEWLTLGRLGTGVLSVTQGGQVTVPELRLGGEASGIGHVDLADSESRIDVGPYLIVGDLGSGTMDVSQQATVTADSLLVGANQSSEGELNVLDAGTTVTVSHQIESGVDGVGTLNITGGADVRTTEDDGWITVGAATDSDGYLLVDDGSTLTAERAPLVVADCGQGALDILGGAVVHTSGELFVGWSEGASGQVSIGGAGSQYISDSGYPAQIGDGGQGTLIVEDGGRFEKPGGCRLGLQSTGVGLVTLNGNTTTFHCGEHLGVGEYGVGTFNVNDARVAVGELDPNDVPPGEIHVAGWAVLTGTGTINGDVVNFDAWVMPGGDPAGTQPGTLTINGDYTQHDGTLQIMLGGLVAGSEYGVLGATGSANIAGTLYIEPIDDFEPPLGTQYVVLTAADVNGTFGLPTGSVPYSVAYGPDRVTVTIKPRGDMNCDGELTFGDINPFVLRLTDPEGYRAAFPNCAELNGDMNNGGSVGFDDINPFVAVLLER